ncbi:MAG: hypothetical protein ACKOFG_11215, partial [Limnohabitans sp.]
MSGLLKGLKPDVQKGWQGVLSNVRQLLTRPKATDSGCFPWDAFAWWDAWIIAPHSPRRMAWAGCSQAAPVKLVDSGLAQDACMTPSLTPRHERWLLLTQRHHDHEVEDMG